MGIWISIRRAAEVDLSLLKAPSGATISVIHVLVLELLISAGAAAQRHAAELRGETVVMTSPGRHEDDGEDVAVVSVRAADRCHGHLEDVIGELRPVVRVDCLWDGSDVGSQAPGWA
jgi:hypothetical protein